MLIHFRIYDELVHARNKKLRAYYMKVLKTYQLKFNSTI